MTQRGVAAGGDRARAIAGFVAFGALWGSWGATLPAVQQGAGVNDGELGLALLCIGLGALASMRAAGTVLDRIGPASLPTALLLLAATAPVAGLAGSLPSLCLTLFALGAASGAADVAINAEATRAEAATARPVLSLAHAMFSAAVIGGSLLAGLLREAGADAFVALGAVATLMGAIAVVISRISTDVGGARVSSPRVRLRGVPRRLLFLGVLCALAFFVENAWQSWGAVYLEDDLGASPGLGALAPAVFAGAAAVARLGAHAAADRLREALLIRVGALVAAAGTLLAATASGVAVALCGLILAGLGISVVAPIVFSLSGRGVEESVRAASVSLVTTVGYLGFVVGPAAVGLLAQATTLRASLAAVAIVALLLGLLTVRLIPPDARGSQSWSDHS